MFGGHETKFCSYLRSQFSVIPSLQPSALNHVPTWKQKNTKQNWSIISFKVPESVNCGRRPEVDFVRGLTLKNLFTCVSKLSFLFFWSTVSSVAWLVYCGWSERQNRCQERTSYHRKPRVPPPTSNGTDTWLDCSKPQSLQRKHPWFFLDSSDLSRFIILCRNYRFAVNLEYVIFLKFIL